ncbi:hypothetical protein [Phocoenobacter skyensis]|uniref:Uncharacterized protein n=1 Tax=Phocoenobacter skyensis TaxID=97481 RepID=A0A1H7XL50_9PAST|nr:hypothetical protein [Pasteurella skyensis]MDP8184371.1 hypothetical protein [Pasteurella skyensis]SEM34405.1 hypothetical protein SAMN05444853_11322 [Pasteurella skyensis]
MNIFLDKVNLLLIASIVSVFIFLNAHTYVDDETANAINTCSLQQSKWVTTKTGGYCE